MNCIRIYVSCTSPHQTILLNQLKHLPLMVHWRRHWTQLRRTTDSTLCRFVHADRCIDFLDGRENHIKINFGEMANRIGMIVNFAVCVCWMLVWLQMKQTDVYQTTKNFNWLMFSTYERLNSWENDFLLLWKLNWEWFIWNDVYEMDVPTNRYECQYDES